ncbi:MAG TPA: hypothetical protein VFG06_11910, partial [Thermodesulfovibrionales bacterium]|nr:hypothetical protein [Thermodesulfovibrionales bacterium]
FLKNHSLDGILEDIVIANESENFSSNWIWTANMESDEEAENECLEKIKYLHRKYEEFEDEELFTQTGVFVTFHSLLIGSVFSMLTKYRVLSKKEGDRKKDEFMKGLLIYSSVSAQFLGLDSPWDTNQSDIEYYLDIRKILNTFIYGAYQEIQVYLERIPKGNIMGNVALSFDVYAAIRQVIEGSYWFASEYKLKSG